MIKKIIGKILYIFYEYLVNKKLRIPKSNRKRKKRIEYFEKRFEQEKKLFGKVMDPNGYRVLLGPLYVLIGENEKAIKAFEWSEKIIPSFSGDCWQYMFWVYALYKLDRKKEAELRMTELIFRNMYLIPLLIYEELSEMKGREGKDDFDIMYADSLPGELSGLWDDKKLRKWTWEIYKSQEENLAEYINILNKLDTEKANKRKEKLEKELYKIKKNALLKIAPNEFNFLTRGREILIRTSKLKMEKKYREEFF